MTLLLTPVDSRDRVSALLIAAEKGQQKMVSLLVQALQNHFISVSLHRCLRRPETLKVLLEAGVKQKLGVIGLSIALHAACRQLGAIATIELLLGAGANPNFLGSLGETPLHVVTTHGNAEVIELLLRAGADPNALNHQGDTALHSAALLR